MDERKAEVKLGIIWVMRFSLMLVFSPVVAFCAILEQLPAPEYVDTEVTAYADLRIPARNARGLDIEMTFTGTASNNVEIALGRDADGDGRLSFHETEVALGWDCGRYFVERFSTGERFEEPASTDGGNLRRLSWHCPVKRGRLLGLAVSNETDAVFASLAADTPAWVYSADWNLMRLTARGVDAPGERFVVTPLLTGFLVDLR